LSPADIDVVRRSGMAETYWRLVKSDVHNLVGQVYGPYCEKPLLLSGDYWEPVEVHPLGTGARLAEAEAKAAVYLERCRAFDTNVRVFVGEHKAFCQSRRSMHAACDCGVHDALERLIPPMPPREATE
jgi:hypothetical protein